MDDKTFQQLWTLALELTDKGKYVEAMTPTLAATGAFDSIKKCENYLKKVWVAANTPMRDIVKQHGFTQVSFAQHFCVTLRTVQGWCSDTASNKRNCPSYVRLLIVKQLGML